MQEATFDTLLSHADMAARNGKWQETFDILSQAVQIESDHPGSITGMGTCLIHLGRPKDAVPYFHKAVDLAHESPEAHNNLGVAFSLSGELESAEEAYLEALSLDPDHSQAWKNLAQAYLQMEDRLVEGIQILAAVVQADPHDVDALLILADCYATVGEYQSAVDLYHRVLSAQPENAQAKNSLSRLSASPLSPDPSRIARPEHAQKLAKLITSREPSATRVHSTPSKVKAQLLSFQNQTPSIILIHDIALLEFRFGIPVNSFKEHNIMVRHVLDVDGKEMDDFEILVFSGFHQDSSLVELVHQGAKAGKKIVIDLETDFYNLPSDHPKFKTAGPGNPQALHNLDDAIALADLVTVPSSALAERYREKAQLIEVIRPSWNKKNPLWEKSMPKHETINIGILATHVTGKDIAILKRDVARFIRETPDALLVAGGDPAIFKHFSTIPDEKKMFLPISSVEEYPFTLAPINILLAPYRDNTYNRMVSDRPLLEAGICSIPWIAPPLPAFREWGQGGLYVKGSGDWYKALQQMFKHPELRTKLGEEGRAKAEKRESRFEVTTWARVLGSLT